MSDQATEQAKVASAETPMPPIPVGPEREGEMVAVGKDGQEVARFHVAIPEMAEFVSWLREFNRQGVMIRTLFDALKKFQDGEANYQGAARNIELLLREIETANESIVGSARGFWRFTDLAQDKEKQKTIERSFSPDGDRFIAFIATCCERLMLTEEERKNSPRGRTGH